jgi:hypothetical protein
MDIRDQAIELLDEYYLCCKSRPKHNAIDLQIEKDSCSKWANNLNNLLAWGSEDQIAEAYFEFAPKLQKLKEKLIFEVLKHGTV